MSIVHVRHPVPVRYIPRGGHIERQRFRAGEAPIRVTQADEGEFRHVLAIIGGTRFFYEHRGRLWTRVRHGREAVQDYLESGRDDLSAHHELYQAFVGTPVCARTRVGAVRGWDHHASGEPFTGQGVRAYVDDGSGAAARLQAFFDDEVRFCGEAVYLRAHPVAFPSSVVAGNFHWMPFPRAIWKTEPVCNLDQVRDLWRLMRFSSWNARASVADGPTLDHAGQVPAALLDPETDIRLMANKLVEQALERLTILPPSRRLPEWKSQHLRRATLALAPLAQPATMGLVGPDQFEAALGAARDSLVATEGEGPDTDLGDLVDFAGGLMLPRLLAPAMSETDAEAFAGLGGAGP